VLELTGRSVLTGKALRVSIKGENIVRVETISEEADLPWLSPGFLDMQVNGFNGIDYSHENLEADKIESLILRLGESGTTRHIPTFVTMPHERMLRNLSLTAETMENRPLVKAAIPGFHLEGPFISPEDGPRGAHNKKYTCLPDFSLFQEWQKAARGLIKYITLAPELPGAIDFIREAVRSGVKVAIGHTAASVEDIRAAVEAGASCSTHLGNGSHAQLPRLKNYIWEQLATDSLWAGIICDGFHLPAAVIKVMNRAKQAERLIMVTDAASLGGFKPGLYKSGDLDVEIFADGHLGLAGTTALAGAAHLLDWGIAHYIEFTGVSLKEAIALCSVQPARFLGLDTAEYTGIVPGNPANLTLFDFAPGDKRLNIRQAVLSGRTIFQA
jgi:N-acetylglucosamine-6-phosphate deacetylase